MDTIHDVDSLQKSLQQENVVLLDVRPAAAYNGWKLQNEARGGHIRGAGSLPLAWARYIDWIEIVRNKEIFPRHKIILYGYNPDEAIIVAERFREAGYPHLAVFTGFMEWAQRRDLPMDQLPRFENLVYPQWVYSLISGQSPPLYSNGKNFVVCHAHYRNHQDYLLGHIPGAISLDTLELESPEMWNIRSAAEIKEALLSKGISRDTTVILYGRYSFPQKEDPFPGSSAGQLAAMRCAHIMLYAGVRDVRILNGGMASWEAENLPLETSENPPLAKDHFGGELPAFPELLVSLEEARQLLKAPDGELVCTRSWPEYIGEVSGYNYIEKKGRIPGAVFISNGSDAYHMESYQNLDYTTRQFSEIARLWESAGLSPGKRLAFYCGTGWRGSEAFFNAWLMGWPRVAVFDGGWYQWSSDPANPVETGPPGE